METCKGDRILTSALEHAAKLICTLKCGVCPIREKDFSGCPYTCNDEIRPWRCWMEHLQQVASSD